MLKIASSIINILVYVIVYENIVFKNSNHEKSYRHIQELNLLVLIYFY